MGVYTFVCKSSGRSEWSAKQISGGDIEASASSTFDLERKLVQVALSRESGVVSSSFSLVTPSSGVLQVIVASGFVGGSGAALAPASSVSGEAAAVAPKPEEKEEAKEESDEEMGGLFDSMWDE
ncbi:hypothetical protein AQUCO_01600039v1 [Aquilegia coerulea]|uniref:60S acidic ribosomal protein P3 n=1 Tax=Aquilegia coerulea TaxID=218851 RepID=A0A2G5DPW2_AQUCA|nr:hypothetical protein AQUCO_01600039v1 [Aquilegia coerulea]